MGLLDLLLKNQSNLDINPVPQQGNGPVGPATGEFNTGTSPFIQTWDSNNTYINSFEGGTNVGIQPPTLAETGLDIDNPNFVSSTSIPNNLTFYPATALGGLGQSVLQFIQIWTPVINYNDVVVGAPTSPLEQSLDQTGLDNTDATAVPTTVSPINTTNYPNLATGEYNSVSNQYNQVYGPNSTYLDNYNPNIQPNSLSETGLDIENIGLVSTTVSPDFNTDYPSLSSGEFRGQSNDFNQAYTPNNTYLNTFNPQTQPNTLNQTGLDIENQNSAPTTVTPSTVTQYPQFVQGEFNTAPNQYNQVWNPTNQYIINYNDNIQPNTVIDGETGLDNTNLLAFNTAFVPNNISSPTNYPQPAQTYLGEFQGAPSQFTPLYNPNPGQSYLDSYNNIISNAGNPQIVNLGNSGLDIENQNSAPTTYNVPFLDNITQYPALVTGELNGAPTLYSQTYTPLLTYNNLVANTPQGTYSILEQSLNQTGLDVENVDASPTVYSVPGVDNITVYPPQVTGEYNGAAFPYTQTYTPNSTYENIIVNSVDGPVSIIENSTPFTGLDVENQDAAPTTYVVPETDDTLYPIVQGAFTTNHIPKPFKQTFTPSNQYYSYMIDNFEGQII